jgi:prolyl 4-hydroxylase
MPSSVVELLHVLSPEECAGEIARATGLGFMSQRFRGPERVEVRNRIVVDDPTTARRLWSKMSHRVPPLVEFYRDGAIPEPDVADLAGVFPNGLNERVRYCRYSDGERFAPHADISHSTGPLRSLLTVILYLNSDFEGGETDFFGHAVTPRAGAAILFPHELRHEGRPVTAGVKYILRTDVMFAPMGERGALLTV